MSMGIAAQKKHFFSKPNLTYKSKTIAVSLVKTHRNNIKNMDKFHPKNKNKTEIQKILCVSPFSPPNFHVFSSFSPSIPWFPQSWAPAPKPRFRRSGPPRSGPVPGRPRHLRRNGARWGSWRCPRPRHEGRTGNDLLGLGLGLLVFIGDLKMDIWYKWIYIYI